jgi:hypothetical protein
MTNQIEEVVMKKVEAEYRQLANPEIFSRAIEENGVLANRNVLAEQFGYDWRARKLDFESHFRGHLLMQMTAYTSTRDYQWAAQNDPLFAACGAGVEISVSGLSQANRDRPLGPLVGLEICLVPWGLPAKPLRRPQAYEDARIKLAQLCPSFDDLQNISN